MSQANRNLVADALESGEFEQDVGFLCKDEKYCCLGVACEIYQRHVGDLEIRTTSNSKIYDNQSQYLPDKVRKWLGLTMHNGHFLNGYLTDLNDIGTPFKEIAKLFRNPPKGLVDDAE